MDNIRHGTRTGYSGGCRCTPCKKAWADYIRHYKQSTGQQQPRAAHLIAKEIEQAEQRLLEIVDGETDALMKVALTPLDLQILVGLQRKTQQRRGEIIGQLLRDWAPHVLDEVA